MANYRLYRAAEELEAWRLTGVVMNADGGGEWVALREDDGRAYLLRRAPGEVKVKGLGRFDAEQLLNQSIRIPGSPKDEEPNNNEIRAYF